MAVERRWQRNRSGVRILIKLARYIRVFDGVCTRMRRFSGAIFRVMLILLFMQIVATKWKGSFSLIKRDTHTGQTSVGVFNLDKSIGVNVSKQHTFGFGYSILGSVSIEYQKRLWNLKFIEVHLGIGVEKTYDNKIIPKFGISLRL